MIKLKSEEGWLRIIKAISLKNNSDGRILTIYKKKDKIAYHTQIEQKNGLMFMRSKKRILN